LKSCVLLLTSSAFGAERQQISDQQKAATTGKCNNPGNCYLGGQDNDTLQGDCYCDEACHGFNDCCKDMEYQCYHGNDICVSEFDGTPESGCYVQSNTWYPGVDVTCAMENDACLSVDCSANSIRAFLRKDLFHTNLHNADSFMDQLKAGTRALYVNNVQVAHGGPCGFSADENGITLDFDYKACDVKPTMKTDSDNCNGKDAVVYSLLVSSPGNDFDGDDVVEFYVDSDVDASCEYCANFMVEADGFYVNQEDMMASGEGMGKMKDLFDCSFYTDRKRRNQIMGHNIVNMGEQLYGVVTSKGGNGGYGLSYKLKTLTLSDPVTGESFDVIKKTKGAKVLNTKTQKTAAVSENIKFRFMSFGFEDKTDQNEMAATCEIELFIEEDNVVGLGRSLHPSFMLQGQDDERYGDDEYQYE